MAFWVFCVSKKRNLRVGCIDGYIHDTVSTEAEFGIIDQIINIIIYPLHVNMGFVVSLPFLWKTWHDRNHISIFRSTSTFQRFHIKSISLSSSSTIHPSALYFSWEDFKRYSPGKNSSSSIDSIETSTAGQTKSFFFLNNNKQKRKYSSTKSTCSFYKL